MLRTSLRTYRVRTVFVLLQHLLQASCYKAKRRISLLTDLLTRVLLTSAILRYWKKQAFTVETSLATCEVETKGRHFKSDQDSRK